MVQTATDAHLYDKQKDGSLWIDWYKRPLDVGIIPLLQSEVTWPTFWRVSSPLLLETYPSLCANNQDALLLQSILHFQDRQWPDYTSLAHNLLFGVSVVPCHWRHTHLSRPIIKMHCSCRALCTSKTVSGHITLLWHNFTNCLSPKRNVQRTEWAGEELWGRLERTEQDRALETSVQM